MEAAATDGVQRPQITGAELRKAVHLDIAQFFYENAIPFHVASTPSYAGMLKSVGDYGRGLVGPTPHDLGGPLLNAVKSSTEKTVEEVKKTWASTGVSIISDGWKDIRGRQLINFLINNPNGTVFLKSVDASDAIKTGEMLFKMLDQVVEEVGEDLVVQVVTDNASNYVAAGRLLMEKRRKLWWTPCAAHCIDLMLEKVGDLPQHKTAIRKAKKVTNYIYNHGWVLHLMKENCKKEIVRPAATRFGTAYLTLESLLDLKQPLQNMFTSTKWAQSTYAKKSDGKQVKKIVLDDGGFWVSVAYAIKTTKPLFHVLRMTDSEKVPAMGFLYNSMDMAKEQIKEAMAHELGAYSEIVNIIDTRWENQMTRPLHAVACYLNPYFHYDDDWAPTVRMKLEMYKAMDRMLDADERENAELQLDIFKLKGGLFGSVYAKNTSKKRAPAMWWHFYGDHCPQLQAFAIKVLSLTTSSSASERNWSTFNQIHTKRRNRLSVERMNSLAYVMYNKKLRERHLKKQSLKEGESLTEDRCPSDDEWIAGLDDEVPSDIASSSGVPSEVEMGSVEATPLTYNRKRKTPATGSLSRADSILRSIDEESSEPDNDGDDDNDAETSDSDDSVSGGGGGEDGGRDASFDPTYRPPDSNDSMFL